MTIIPGQITLELLIGNPLLYYGALFAAATIAGLLRGKMESDEAKAGNAQFKGKDNVTISDWAEDAGLGFVGATIGIVILQYVQLPTEIIVVFGYIGRYALINFGKKAEKIIDETTK